jgi:hypothetical protein
VEETEVLGAEYDIKLIPVTVCVHIRAILHDEMFCLKMNFDIKLTTYFDLLFINDAC